MTTFADYICDIVQNAFSAKASTVIIHIIIDEHLSLIVKDNGKGMTKRQIKSAITPFYSTRKTRKIGLGLPLMILLTDQTNGTYHIKSSKICGTTVTFTFDDQHLDFPPFGDMGLLIADIASNQQLKKCRFIYKDKQQAYTWRYKNQSRQTIIKEINENLTYRGDL